MPLTPLPVALVKGAVRYDNVLKALQLIEASVKEKIANSMRIVIKPDFFFPRLGMSTSADSVKAVLDFVLEFTNKRITIAEGLYNGNEVQPAFHKADLHELHEDYGLRYVDLNRDGFVTINLGRDPLSLAKGSKLSVRIAKTVINSDFRISLAVPKLVDTSFSAAAANLAVGSVISNGKLKNDKAKLLSYGAEVAEILKVIHPHLSVVDGFVSVVNKGGIETNFCIASADGVAADVIAAAALSKSMNENKKIRRQKYLDLCSKAGLGQSSMSKIAVVGQKL